MDVIKSFGDASMVKQVLYGTEELLALLRGNAQLTRRTEEVFFDAYDYGSETDREAFNSIFAHLHFSLPIEKSVSLEKHLDEVFLRSAGCVGILKDWLTRALGHALIKGRERVTFSDLMAVADSDARLQGIADGITKFRIFTRDQPYLDQIRVQLGMPARGSLPRKKRRTGKAGRVGVRNPVRDVVFQPGEMA